MKPMKHLAVAAVIASTASLANGSVIAQTLTIGLGTEPTSIDPHYHNLGPNNQIAQHFFSRLIEQDHKQNSSPGLATSWKTLSETTWEFKLRKGVKFHDGSAFDADDVLFSVHRAGNHPNARSSFGLYTTISDLKKLITAVSDLADRREEIVGLYEPVGTNGYRHMYFAPDAEDIFDPEAVLAQSIE